ncbi:CDP-alcohol phosphatidyltransferase family protein [Candidatus Poribacteria bacterium]|nr:CDP-alcohol phosphatidyltransferase family protein [Candidatus Poribacteria bacterium]
MLSKLKGWFTHLTNPVAHVLISLGVTANTVTILGFVINVVAGILFAYERLILAGILLVVGGSFDMIDGAVARMRKVGNSSGALLDSVIDRYSEGAIFMGIAVYFYKSSGLYGILGLLLTFATMIGSFLVSYTRARSEGLAVECNVGLMQRTERLVLLAISVIANGILKDLVANNLILIMVLAILTIFTHITAVHRLIYSFRRLRNLSGR